MSGPFRRPSATSPNGTMFVGDDPRPRPVVFGDFDPYDTPRFTAYDTAFQVVDEALLPTLF